MTSPALYVHLPFCTSKCHYCAFAVVTDLQHQEAYIDALLGEASLRGVRQGDAYRTLYLGGGTPSLLAPALLEKLLRHLPGAQEITVEGNPEQITPDYLRFLEELGVTRVSMGVQTLDDSILARMNRRHTKVQSLAALEALAASGLSWNVDLILGLPGSRQKTSCADLEHVLSYGPHHLSAYFLSVEPGTVLTRMLDQTSDAEVTETYQAFCSHLQSAGFDHYEISNWAQPGHRSVHNSIYWATEPYTGLGLGSGSFEDGRLWSNTRNLRLYLSGQYRSEIPQELSGSEVLELVLMTQTRRLEGASWSDVAPLASTQHQLLLQKRAAELQQEGYLQISPTHLRLHEHAFPYHDHVLRRLLG